MKTAGQIDGRVSFTAGQFAWCPALNEPPDYIKMDIRVFQKRGLSFI